MSGITYDYMEKYIRDLIPENHGILKNMEVYAYENDVPIVQKETANFLRFMINLKKPQRILELGTAIGYSSILMHLESNKTNNIVTIERNEKMVEIATKNIIEYNFENNIKIEQGECLEKLDELCQKQDKFDLIFIDAGKGHYNHFLPYCLDLLEDDGIIIADNVLFRGMVASRELLKRRKITIVKRMKEYLEIVSDNKKFITTVIPMGDGIAVTMRRD